MGFGLFDVGERLGRLNFGRRARAMLAAYVQGGICRPEGDLDGGMAAAATRSHPLFSASTQPLCPYFSPDPRAAFFFPLLPFRTSSQPL